MSLEEKAADHPPQKLPEDIHALLPKMPRKRKRPKTPANEHYQEHDTDYEEELHNAFGRNDNRVRM